MFLPARRAKFLLTGLALAVLGACSGGGGSGGGGSSTPPPPLTAGDTLALTSGNRLISFNRSTPGATRTAVAISGLNSGETLLAMDFRPANGLLYALTSAARLVTLNTTTGLATQAAVLAADPGDASPTPNNAAFAGLTGSEFGIDFNPVVDRLRVVSNSGQNLRVNVDSGLVITDGALTSGGAAATGVTAAAYTNSFGAACRTSLFYLNTDSDALFTTSAPNDGVLTRVGTGLGVNAGPLNAFDILTAADGSNTALAVFSTSGGPTLYRIDTASGLASVSGGIAVASGESIRGLALAPPATAPVQPAGELYGLTEGNGLISFNRRTTGKLCSSVSIAPLAAGETVVGIDFRPSTGLLYAVANANGAARLLQVDPATGATSAPVPISQALVGTEFGIDFNPTGPVALRIVSNTGQNLRVTDIATGAATLDGGLNGAGLAATAAAYSNSLAGAGNTTLYVLDTDANQLLVQNPPNAGTLVAVGGLGTDIGGVNGFDIDGRNNQALVAASTAAGTTSTLHTLDLVSGSLSASLGTVAGGARLRGLTRPTPVTTVFGLTAPNTLVQLSLTDPTVVTPVAPITGLIGENLVGIDFRPSTGLLYGLGSRGGLFSIDPVSGLASRVALSADPADATAAFSTLGGSAYGLDFNPTGPVALRVVGDTGENLRIPDVGTGRTFTDTALTRTFDLFALGAIAYSNSTGPGPASTVLYALDALGNRLVTVTPPNLGAVRVIGGTGAEVAADSAFEIIGPATATSPGTALAVFEANTDKTLYSVNLATGAGTPIGVVGISGSVRGLAARISATEPAADSLVYVAGSGGNLVSFARNAPATVTVIGALGIGVGEVIEGIDFRADGVLWLLSRVGTVGRLYTVNTTTGAATLASTLLPADAASTYAGLSGTSFGMDFNPLPAGLPLRIISNTGQNLRVTSPATGATVVDGSGQPAPDVMAAAYSNSYPAATTTLLYVIDAATGSLLLQNPPNDGTLVSIGPLSPGDLYSLNSGFDIAGGANGLALAALQKTTETAQSRLYRINLLTGAATEVTGPSGGGTGVVLRGLAVQLR